MKPLVLLFLCCILRLFDAYGQKPQSINVPEGKFDHVDFVHGTSGHALLVMTRSKVGGTTDFLLRFHDPAQRMVSEQSITHQGPYMLDNAVAVRGGYVVQFVNASKSVTVRMGFDNQGKITDETQVKGAAPAQLVASADSSAYFLIEPKKKLLTVRKRNASHADVWEKQIELPIRQIVVRKANAEPNRLLLLLTFSDNFLSTLTLSYERLLALDSQTGNVAFDRLLHEQQPTQITTVVDDDASETRLAGVLMVENGANPQECNGVFVTVLNTDGKNVLHRALDWQKDLVPLCRDKNIVLSGHQAVVQAFVRSDGGYWLLMETFDEVPNRTNALAAARTARWLVGEGLLLMDPIETYRTYDMLSIRLDAQGRPESVSRIAKEQSVKLLTHDHMPRLAIVNSLKDAGVFDFKLLSSPAGSHEKVVFFEERDNARSRLGVCRLSHIHEPVVRYLNVGLKFPRSGERCGFAVYPLANESDFLLVVYSQGSVYMDQVSLRDFH